VRDDFDIDRFRALPSRVFAPRREGLVRCLSRVTTARESDVASALEVDPRDKFKAALSLVVSAEGAWPGPASGREAWETVAPLEWLDDDRRRFERGGEAPATVRDAVTIACDPEGIASAEALARTFALECHRLLNTGESSHAVGWKIVDPKRFRSRFCARAMARSGDEVFAAACKAHKSGGDDALASATPPALARDLDALRRELVARAGPVGWDVSALLAWNARLHAHSVPSPFETALSIWELGYALDELADGRVILAAPSV
jgi:hypothetical protein